jgi:IclR family acetate operon transcriptional repressor
MPREGNTSIDKALDLLELLSEEQEGLPLRDLAGKARLPAPTTHRLLSVLRRRGFVRQDPDSGRYGLTLKVLDLSFRYLNRSELRLHAYPALRDYTSRTAARAFVAAPAAGEVTYVWGGQDEAPAMYSAYGKPMPGHCAMFYSEAQVRRLSCARLCGQADVARSHDVVRRFGEPGERTALRLNCACAPVRDYTGQEVARVGVFSHGQDEDDLHTQHARAAWDLARATSLRLGHLPREADVPTQPQEEPWPT